VSLHSVLKRHLVKPLVTNLSALAHLGTEETQLTPTLAVTRLSVKQTRTVLLHLPVTPRLRGVSILVPL
jgi:hypothetical protein